MILKKNWAQTTKSCLQRVKANGPHWPQRSDKIRYGSNIAWKTEQSAITDHKDQYF